jgi:hypothetical protein
MILFAMIVAVNLADVEAWKMADALCQPPTRDEQACQKRAKIDKALVKAGWLPQARPSKGQYWEVYWTKVKNETLD